MCVYIYILRLHTLKLPSDNGILYVFNDQTHFTKFKSRRIMCCIHLGIFPSCFSVSPVFPGSCWHHSPSAWRTSFNKSFKVGLLPTTTLIYLFIFHVRMSLFHLQSWRTFPLIENFSRQSLSLGSVKMGIFPLVHHGPGAWSMNGFTEWAV